MTEERIIIRLHCDLCGDQDFVLIRVMKGAKGETVEKYKCTKCRLITKSFVVS